MSEDNKIIAFQKKLKQLEDEEQMILKILKNVRNQLKKYEIEELQTSCDYISNRENDEGSDSDESIGSNPESLLKILDCADMVNDASMNLSLNKILGKLSESESSEEFDESEDD